MKFYSTNRKAPEVDLKNAVLNGLAPDNGLYMPEVINPFKKDFFEDIEQYDFPDLAAQISRQLLSTAIDLNKLDEIVKAAVNFPAPVIQVNDNIHTLELFHGPSLAFKDFGARFMARLMSYFVEGENRKLHILVATSGDTGGAVALGFHGMPNIHVTILYPQGKVSPLQEKQLTTLGGNITALEIDGTFDDCQAMVKQAFLDTDLRKELMISSANSINISRLIPQIFYYFEAYKQVKKSAEKLMMCVPSGNFGNITAGLFGLKMGLPFDQFVAAVNNNDGFHRYMETGHFEAKPSVQTLSTAMDVGNPSNLARINDIYKDDVALIRTDIHSASYDDPSTQRVIKEVYDQKGYILDPHGAVGYLASKAFAEKHPESLCIFQETAHPSKFKEIVEPLIGKAVEIPEQLRVLMDREKESIKMDADYAEFKTYLNSLKTL